MTVTASVSLDFLDGKHDTGVGSDRLNFVPLPLGEIAARSGRTALHGEGFPPFTFSYPDGGGGTQATRLSIINATLRQDVGGGFFAGFGQTIYNQLTTDLTRPGTIVQSQSSRVTGPRFEAGYGRRLAQRLRLEYVFAANPAMHGVERTALRGPFARGQIATPERAAQVDTALRLHAPFADGDLILGLRYLNYTSRYVRDGSPFDGLLADRNVGVLPILGYARRW